MEQRMIEYFRSCLKFIQCFLKASERHISRLFSVTMDTHPHSFFKKAKNLLVVLCFAIKMSQAFLHIVKFINKI